MTSREVQTAPALSGEQSAAEHDCLMLAKAAIAGLEDLAAGLVVEEGAINDALRVDRPAAHGLAGANTARSD